MHLCAGGDTQPPTLTLRVPWLPMLAALWLEGGGAAQAWRSRSSVSGPRLPSRVASCPAGQTSARSADARRLPSASHSILGSQVRGFHCCPVATFHRGQVTGPKPALWRRPGCPLTETRPSAHGLPAILALSPPEPLLPGARFGSALCSAKVRTWAGRNRAPFSRRKGALW